ncbi:MAG: thioredoxin fold domain-containing protein [Thiohalocapsa sp.]|nr:thioredoxin fold domain-containing protein [Thiohalocapsa sp.]MCF7992506.1 thioredoxin fold domain-containing protein [Thiohalocapsa sp.]
MTRSSSALAAALILSACCLWPPGVWAVDADFDDGAIYQIVYPDWFKESFLHLPDDAAEAAEDGKQGLFVFFSTQGCSYCHLFIEQSLGDPAIAERLRAHFDSIGLEIFSDAEMTDFDDKETRVKAFAVDQGVQFAPTLLFFDTEGERLLRLTGYYDPQTFDRVLDYLIGGHHREIALRDYLRAGQTSSEAAGGDLLSDPMFAQPPYALDRSRVAAERPLLVLFESADCPRCERFHREVLGDAPTRERLKAFDVVRLDAADDETPVLTPGGTRTVPNAWLEELGFTQLPALAFFNETGELVLASDALILKSRMNNSIGFVTERKYEQGWNYQRYARSQGMKKAAGEQ